MTISQKIRFVFKTIFYLPGTLLHELAHFIGFWIMGFRDLKLSIIPKNILSSYEVTMGTATAMLPNNYSKVRLVLPAILPKIFILLLYYLLEYLDLIETEFYTNALSISFYFESLSLFDYQTYLILYLSTQLIWASSLSFQDWKMFFLGLFSLGGAFLTLIIITTVWVFQYMQFLQFVE